MLKFNMEVLEKEDYDYNEIAEAYLERDVKTEEGERDLYISIALDDLMQWYPLAGTIGDEQTFGEFTRRTERAIEDLKKLGYNITKIEA